MANEQDPILTSEAHVDSRDFRVQTVTVVSAGGTSIDITKMVSEVSVRQDIYLSFMNGEMLVTDGIDLHTQLNFHGGEYVYLHFKVPEQDIEIRKAFRIYKISKREFIKNNSQRYVVHFCSDELFISNTTRISKSYRNQTLANIVADVLKSYLKVPAKRIFVEETPNQLNVIVPSWRPAETINWCVERAYSGSNMTNYFFYENFDGFHFKPLASIYKQGTVIKVPYTIENKRAEKNLDMDKFAVDHFSAKKDFDILSTAASGGYAMQLIRLDPIEQSATLHTYSADRNASKLYADNPSMSNVNKVFESTSALQCCYGSHEGIENWIVRNMSLSLLNNSLVEIVVPGNLGLQVGTLINTRIPWAVPPSDGNMWNRKRGGKYLVVGVNHHFDLLMHRHSSILMLTRDSLPEALPIADAKLMDKVNRLTL